MYCMLMCCADKIINSVNCLNPVADSWLLNLSCYIQLSSSFSYPLN
jgi:hypothetical protein